MYRAPCQGWGQACYLGCSVTSWYLARIVVAKLAQAHSPPSMPSLVLVNRIGSIFSFLINYSLYSVCVSVYVYSWRGLLSIYAFC